MTFSELITSQSIINHFFTNIINIRLINSSFSHTHRHNFLQKTKKKLKAFEHKKNKMKKEKKEMKWKRKHVKKILNVKINNRDTRWGICKISNTQYAWYMMLSGSNWYNWTISTHSFGIKIKTRKIKANKINYNNNSNNFKKKRKFSYTRRSCEKKGPKAKSNKAEEEVWTQQPTSQLNSQTKRQTYKTKMINDFSSDLPEK